MPKNYSHPPEKDCGTEKIRNREAERIIIFGSFNRWLWFKNILSDILKLKTQAIRISHTGTASCRLWVEERYGYALGKQYKSQPVFYGWISVIPSLKYSQIREDLLRFVPWHTENLPRKKSATQSRRFLLDFRWLLFFCVTYQNRKQMHFCYVFWTAEFNRKNNSSSVL